MKNLLLTITLCLLLFSCKNPFEPENENRTIKYTITGTCAKADATYEFTGGTQQESNIKPGQWAKSYNAKKGDFVYISAQNYTATGDITVSIYVDDRLFKTATSSGAYVIATASGSAD